MEIIQLDNYLLFKRCTITRVLVYNINMKMILIIYSANYKYWLLAVINYDTVFTLCILNWNKIHSVINSGRHFWQRVIFWMHWGPGQWVMVLRAMVSLLQDFVYLFAYMFPVKSTIYYSYPRTPLVWQPWISASVALYTKSYIFYMTNILVKTLVWYNVIYTRTVTKLHVITFTRISQSLCHL